MTLMLGHKSLWRETEEKPLISLEYYSFRDKQVRGGGGVGRREVICYYYNNNNYCYCYYYYYFL